jgi:hypothetical protein
MNRYERHVTDRINARSSRARKAVVQALRSTRNGGGRGGDRLVVRQRDAAYIAKRAERGMVALVVEAMDCDCYRTTSSIFVPATVMHVTIAKERMYEGAEGPMHIWIERPTDAPEYEGRDLALQAFEDGHPHVVYA